MGLPGSWYLWNSLKNAIFAPDFAPNHVFRLSHQNTGITVIVQSLTKSIIYKCKWGTRDMEQTCWPCTVSIAHPASAIASSAFWTAGWKCVVCTWHNRWSITYLHRIYMPQGCMGKLVCTRCIAQRQYLWRLLEVDWYTMGENGYLLCLHCCYKSFFNSF